MADAKVEIHPGETYGTLTVIEPAPHEGQYHWKVSCSCGSVYTLSKYSIKKREGKDCGCHMSRYRPVGRSRHLHNSFGRSTPEYTCWNTMLARCYNPESKTYDYYGGRGVVVCDRWRESFEAFLEDMGPRPDRSHTLDRIDNDRLVYEPGNCRWATKKEQARNQRSNRLITVDGVTHCVGEWAEITGLGDALYRRLYRGWSEEQAVKTPRRDLPAKV